MSDRRKEKRIRRLAMQILYQLDARGETDAEAIKDDCGADEPVDFVAPAFEIALAAFRDRRSSDSVIGEIAPQWPASRQAAVDRAILRLAHYEMCSGRVNPKIAVNEAVKLAKEYGGEHSFAFVNGVLDKVLKRVLAEASAQDT